MVKRGRGRPRKSPPGEAAEFFKVFLPPLCSHRLRIPPDFIKDFSRTINERVILKDVDGKQWQVDVQRTPDGVFLKNGWQSFVDHHCLELGEFLVFRYDGNYSFNVKMFGINGCKKRSYSAQNVATNVKTEEETDEEVEAKQTSCKRGRLHEVDHLKRGNQRAGRSTENPEYLKDVDSELPENSVDLKIVDRVIPKCPYFISSPTQSDQYRLQIPNEVIDRHNLHLDGEMTLRTANGKEWAVNIYDMKDGRTYLGGGWWSFQKDNNMGPKDSCIFTFQTGRLSRTINVRILRAKVW